MLTVPRTLAKMTKRITSLRTIEPPRELKPFPCFMSWHPRLTNEAAHAWLREQVRIVARSRAPTRGVVFTEDVVKIAGEPPRWECSIASEGASGSETSTIDGIVCRNKYNHLISPSVENSSPNMGRPFFDCPMISFHQGSLSKKR